MLTHIGVILFKQSAIQNNFVNLLSWTLKSVMVNRMFLEQVRIRLELNGSLRITLMI
jgi:hypothetical protein